MTKSIIRLNWCTNMNYRARVYKKKKEKVSKEKNTTSDELINIHRKEPIADHVET